MHRMSFYHPSCACRLTFNCAGIFLLMNNEHLSINDSELFWNCILSENQPTHKHDKHCLVRNVYLDWLYLKLLSTENSHIILLWFNYVFLLKLTQKITLKPKTRYFITALTSDRSLRKRAIIDEIMERSDKESNRSSIYFLMFNLIFVYQHQQTANINIKE